MNKITQRILTKLNDQDLIDKLLALPKSDLNSLLLALFEKQTSDLTPNDVLRAFQQNRFSVPSEIDLVTFKRLEIELLSLAQEMNIRNVLLSPSAPLGSCSAFGCVNQNNVVSATRQTETLADPTNMLAILIADKLSKKDVSLEEAIHYSTTARVVRAQAIFGKGFYAHFGLYCMVSSLAARGSYESEKELLAKHLHYYKTLFLKQYDAKLSIVLRKRSGYKDVDGFFERMTSFIQTECPDIPMSFDLDHADNEYYKGINFKLYVEKNGEVIEVGDGGFVDWISQMTSDKKNRCLISGIGLDRLLIF